MWLKIFMDRLFVVGLITLKLCDVAYTLTIDNQLTLIKNDCYERLAIGHRLRPDDVFKTVKANTVSACQKGCTEEQDVCRSLTFGVGVKGNTTCELSKTAIKETANLQPIGTVTDTDFDLYIKKLGCKLVIDPKKPAQGPYSVPKPENTDLHQRPNSYIFQDPTNGNIKPNESEKPSNQYQDALASYQEIPSRPVKPQDPLGKPNDETYHVQTLVSISSGLQSYLHPVHEILIGENPYKDNKPGLNRPSNDAPNGWYNNYNHYHSQKPISEIPPRPVNDEPLGYDNFRPHRPIFDIPPRPEWQSHYNDDLPHRPNEHGYDNDLPLRPHRPFDDEIPPRPSNPPAYGDKQSYRPITNIPPRPIGPGGYGDDSPQTIFNDSPPKPVRPSEYDDRPFYRPILDVPLRPMEYNENRPPKPVHNVVSLKPEGYNDILLNRPSAYNDRPPFRPSNLDHPYQDMEDPMPPKNRPGDYLRPELDRYDTNYYGELSYGKPFRPRPSYEIYDDPRPNYNRPDHPRPLLDRYGDAPYFQYNSYNQIKPHYHRKPIGSPYDDWRDELPYASRRPYFDRVPIRHQSNLHSGPSEYLFGAEVDRNDKVDLANSSLDHKPANASMLVDNHNKPETSNQTVKSYETYKKPIVTQSVGVDGERITSIITEIESPCFRRVLAGKRVSRGFVRRALVCERLAECQEECAHEKRFTCEGFNYRLDPSGRGKGECELLEVPLQLLDIGRDIYTDRDYDYYERDRNAVRSNNCEGFYRRPGYQGTYPDPMPPRRYDPWPPGYNRRYDYDRRPTSDDRYLPAPNRRGDFSYHQTQFTQLGYENTHNYHHTDRFDSFYHQPGIRYLPPKPSNRPNIQPPSFDYKTHDHKSQGSYLPPDRRYDKIPEDKRYGSRNPEQGWLPNSYRGGSYGGNYGSFGHHDVGHYRPHSDSRIPGTYKPDYQVPNKDWGQYGGTYGNGISGYEQGHYGHQTVQSWDVDTNKINYDHGSGYFYHKPQPQLPPILQKHDTYVPLPPKTELQIHITHEGPNIHNNGDNSLYPLEPRLPSGYSHVKDECSLRSATGFKLHKGIVKKFYAVPNIYECELLCFKEKDFPCASYAYRYTIPLTTQTDNCYLSNKNYKELDYYTDLEPDRDFDIYTMNNMDKCRQPMITGRDNSECFWRVRSGQRLDHRIVKDTLLVKSIVQCQIECLQSRRFTCRAFSFRYGSPISGGAIDNCQLTDWPFYELDPRTNFMPEPGYEVYERGSYGHGCEPYHFDVRGKHDKNPALRVDQLCYVGFGSPARLLPQATKKSLRVNTELDCKAECSKFREGSLFECMSFSYRTVNPHHGINCYLSDILQRDLLPTVDYIQDPDSWLFAWDNFNPECTALADKPIHKPFLPDNHIGSGIGIGGRNDEIGIHSGLDTWRAYSVSGWPCRRGSLCQENREAGFWFCELEGGDANSWDYCCRPDHQCGYSEGFPYQWCYVGSVKTQWRKCSDRYYPYVHNIIDRIDLSQQHRPYLPVHSLPPTHSWVAGDIGPPPLQYRPGIRPNRPPGLPTLPPPQPSLDDYEMQFDQHFLAPPKPGGFGQPRHWPVSYLHKEMPPNITDSDARLMQSIRNEDGSTKLNAIQSLINIIQSNDLQNVQYQITNQSNNMDDILYVKIPLPTNFTKDVKTEKMQTLKSGNIKLEPVNFNENVANNNTRRWSKSISVNLNTSQNTGIIPDHKKNNISSVPIYRKSYITRTNITSHGTKSKI